jgi:putative ABC transport system permease protein
VTGVIVGSACIVLVVTVTLGGKKQVISAIEACGSNLVFAYNPGDQIYHAVADELTLDDMEKARELPHVKQVAGTHDISRATVVIDGRSHPVALVGVTEGFQEIRDLVVRQGRFFDDLDIKDYAKVCLITPDLAARFGRNMIGSIVHIGELQFTVIGIFQERRPTYGRAEFAPDSVLVPFPYVRLYNGQNFLRTLYVQADSLQFVPTVTDEVRDMLKSQHRKEMKYQVDNVIAILDAAHRISIALTLVLLAVASITLLISGVGIMNIMLVTVTERTPEIGLRRALGARRRDILYQFLVEAGLISGIGAIVGILIAIGAATVARWFVPAEYGLQVPISLPSIVLSFVVSSGIGVVFGYLPAKKASALQPALAVHYE